jgi:replicative DNA helicase Mcm
MAEKKKRKTKPVPEEGRKTELVARFKELLHKKYKKALNKAALEEKALVVQFPVLSKFSYELGEKLLDDPDFMFEVAKEAVETFELPGPVTVRFMGLPELTSIRDLRSKHIRKFLVVEGTVRRASEIRPEIQKVLWECPECGDMIEAYSEVGMIRKPFACNCGNRTGFIKKQSVMVDTRWLTIEEPFELTEGDRPSQINIVLTDDLVSPDGRRTTDPGNRIKVTGILRETPKGKIFSSKLDFFISSNHIEATEIGWHRLDVSEEDEKEIKRLAKDPNIYNLMIGSLAPSLWGLTEIKESIIMQLFGGVPQKLKDKTHIRGDIHCLLIGDPASGKSQLLKLVPEIVPRGKYVSGKGTTGAGLCTVHDSNIQLSDGSIVKIGDLVENELKDNQKQYKPGITVATNPSKRKILSLDNSDGKLRPQKITQYWKLKAPKRLARITTQSGKEVIVTPDNPILTINNGEFEWKKARKLLDNDYIACPRKILPSQERLVSITDSIDENAHLMNVHDKIKEISRIIKQKTTIREFSSRIGLREDKIYHFWTNKNAAGKPTMKEFRSVCSELDLNPDSILPSKIYLSQYNGHTIGLPKYLSDDFMYLAGLLAGDGSISKTGYQGFDIKFSNTDSWLLQRYGQLCEENVISPRFEKSRDRIPYLRFRSKIFANIISNFGIPHGKKAQKLHITRTISKLPNHLISSFLQGVFDTDGSVYIRKSGSSGVELDSVSESFIRGIQLLLLKFKILSSIRSRRPTTSVIRGRSVISKRRWTLEIRNLSNLRQFNQEIGFQLPRKQETLNDLIKKIGAENTNIDIVPGISNLIRSARKSAGLSAKDLYGYKNYTYEKGLRDPSQKMLKKIVSILKSSNDSKEIRKLDILANSDLQWERIKQIEIIQNKDHEFVYDVSVENDHSFMCNGMIIHNTATVTKDEQFMGGWVLEAGAMVLANRGMLAVDEFEKMSPEDQVAMHEGLEQGTVSIAKASIVATLPAKTAVLAGGNPKFSRFDPYVPIAKQIIIPDTLLSRFDLKFALRDVPDAETDKRVVDHVMKTREDHNYEGAVPKLDPDFIRKYIAYAREHCQPQFNREAGKILRNFYIRTRKKAEGSASPVPITMRQFEALLRISEASAKVQLQPVVRKEDAQRAIRLMRFSLKQLGFDPETGEIDIDRSEGGTPASERGRIRTVLDIIDELSKTKKEISLDDLRSKAREEGVDDIDEIIERLKTQGLLFEPSPGFVQKV